MSIDPRAPSRQLVTLVSEVVADDHSKELLHEAGFALRERFDIGPLTSERELEAALQNAWAVVAGAESYSNSLLDRLPDLRVIARPGAGHDAIDLTAATAHDVLVFVTPGANADAVADMTIGLILACLRQIPAADRAVRSDRWREGALGGDLYGSTVGIVGLGRIGRGVARRLRGFDVTVLGCDPFADPASGFDDPIIVTSLDNLLRRSDVVTVHIPLNDSTRGMFGVAEFGQMKPGSVFVNTSRGPIVDEIALVDALRDGRVSAAGLDVFGTEPLPAEHPLRALENVVLSGHIASFSRGAMTAMSAAVTNGLLAAVRCTAPDGALNAPVVTSWATD